MTLALPSRFIEHVRTSTYARGRATPLHRLPDGRTAIVFRVTDEGRRGDVSVLGPRTSAMFKSATGVARAVTLQLKPGWAASLLGVAAHEVTDRIVPLEDVWGCSARDLCAELLAARSMEEIVTRLTRAITARADAASHERFEPASARLARRAVHLLEGDEVRVDSVAERLGVTPRHLRRAFTENIGIGPKDFARSVRLQRAVRMTETSRDWSRIAVDSGYYDQAHLIADFRELVGLTPGAFVKRATAREALAPAAE